MAIFLDNNAITGSLLRMVETPNGYIINGAYYDKNNMAPEPLKVYNTLGQSDRVLMNKNAIVTMGSACDAQGRIKNCLGDTLIIDSNDPNKFYLFFPIADFSQADVNITIAHFEQKQGQIEQKWIKHGTTTALTGTVLYGCQFIKILAQNKTYIYIHVQYNAGGSSAASNLKNGAIVAINKTTGDVKAIYARGYQNVDFQFLRYEDQVVKCAYVDTANTSILTINGETCTLLTSKVIESRSDYRTSQVIEKNGSYYLYLTLKDFTKTNVVRYFGSLNSASDFEVLTKDINLNGNALSFTDGIKMMVYSYIVDISGIKYLNIVRFNPFSGSDNVEEQGIYTFRILDDDSLAFINKVKISVNSIKAFLTTNDNMFAITADDAKVTILRFDIASKAYKIINEIASSVHQISLDKEESLWTMDKSGVVHKHSLPVPTTIDIKFKDSNYEYVGEDINTELILNAYNYIGDRLSISLDLVIQGNAIFTSNNNKSITEVTDVSSQKSIPIKITGPGMINIYPKVTFN